MIFASGIPAVLARAWRGTRLWLREGRVRFVFDRRYGIALPDPAHDARRAGRILSFLISERLLRHGDTLRPRPSSIRALRRIHTDAYLESLQSPSSLVAILGYEIPDSSHDAFLLAHRYHVGGTVLASRLALANRGVAVNLGGGFHHAVSDRGQGFCVFNDVAVAVADRRAAGFDGPVLVIDLDLHDGDGTRAIFARDGTVHTFSIHNRHLGPVEAEASTSIELGAELEDERYLELIRERLPGVLSAVRPELVFYLAGCDTARDDALGDWSISASGILERDRFVLDQVRSRRRGPPLVILLAGGYGQDAWRYSARFFARMLGNPRLEPPATSELALAQYRDIARMLRVSELTAERSAADWDLTEEDLLPSDRVARPSSRLLDYYSKHGIELALERYGVLDRLRKKGFRSPVIEWELDDPAGQMLRIRTGGRNPVSVAEVRLRVDRRTVPEMGLLSVEWLLLQNPRSGFSATRPRLPGQRYPGLGLLREVSALLVLVCERLGLDGMIISPAHYHIAALSRAHFRFLHAEREACYRRLREALGGLRLLEAVRVIEAGRLVNRRTGEPFRWIPSPMVHAVSDRLKLRVQSRAYEREVAQAESRFDFALPAEGAPPGP